MLRFPPAGVPPFCPLRADPWQVAVEISDLALHSRTSCKKKWHQKKKRNDPPRLSTAPQSLGGEITPVPSKIELFVTIFD